MRYIGIEEYICFRGVFRGNRILGDLPPSHFSNQAEVDANASNASRVAVRIDPSARYPHNPQATGDENEGRQRDNDASLDEVNAGNDDNDHMHGLKVDIRTEDDEALFETLESYTSYRQHIGLPPLYVYTDFIKTGEKMEIFVSNNTESHTE